MLKSKLPILFIAIVTPFFIVTSGAHSVNGDGDIPPIDRAKQEAAIDSVCAALDETYVFPDVAGEVGKFLRKQFKKGEYREIKTIPEFAEKLTEDMYSIAKDKHLSLRYMPDSAFEEQVFDSLSDEEKAIRREKRLREYQYENFGFVKLERLPGNVGYLRMDSFSDTRWAGNTAIAAMNFLAHCDAVIFDLRNNGGGSPSMIQLIFSYLLDEPTHLNSFYIRSSDSIKQFWSYDYVEGPRMTDTDVYVLTSERTFSAAEEFTYNMKNLERGMIIGELTGGGAHPNKFGLFPNLNLGMSIPFGRAINPVSGTNWEGTGVQPDIEVPRENAFDRGYLEALKNLRQKHKNTDKEFGIEWAIRGIEAKLNPVNLTANEMRKFAGDYGPRRITLENGQLYYQREENPKYHLIPMGNDWFMINELDYFRISFEVDKRGNPRKIVGHYDNGHTDEHLKN